MNNVMFIRTKLSSYTQHNASFLYVSLSSCKKHAIISFRFIANIYTTTDDDNLIEYSFKTAKNVAVVSVIKIKK